MKVTLQVDLEPFKAPNFVIAADKVVSKQEGMLARQSYPLSSLDAMTLDKLCDQFRSEVFRKPRKEQLCTDAARYKLIKARFDGSKTSVCQRLICDLGLTGEPIDPLDEMVDCELIRQKGLTARQLETTTEPKP